MNRGRSYITSVGLTAVGMSLIAPAVAQEVSGLTATFGVKQSIETSDNLDLTNPATAGTRGVTELSFGLASVTSTSRLAFNTAGNFEFGEGDTGFTDPSASITYATSTRNSRLTAQAGYFENDVNALTTVVANTNGFGLNEQLVVGSGTRLRTSANLNFETGLDAPLGFVFDASYVGVDYRDTIDPDLFETEKYTFGIIARMRLNSAATLNLGTEFEAYEAQDDSNTTRDNRSVFVEGNLQVRSDITATTRLSYDRNETTTTSLGGGPTSTNTTSVDEGFGGSFAITKTLKDGTIDANFSSRVTSDGRRDTFRVTRALDLPRGAFSLSLGVVKTESSDPQPLVDMTLSQNLPRGALTLSLSQQVSIGDDDETIVNTGLRAAYDEQINASSSWGLSAALADTASIELGDNTRRLDLGVNYRHEVARDWDVVANYTYSSSDQTGEEMRSSNTVSLSLQKTFQFRP